MKTLTEYEPSDIDMHDAVHTFVLCQIFIVLITGVTPDPSDPDDNKLLPVHRLVANFLNAAQKAGISISKSELPVAFT